MIGINKMFEHLNKQKGFTLIEVIVVMAVFLSIIAGAISIFISIIIYQKRILSEGELLSQTSYATEYMSKALRMADIDETGECLEDEAGNPLSGYIYLLTRHDIETNSYKGIKFINQSDTYTDTGGIEHKSCQEFYLDDSDPLKPVLKENKFYIGTDKSEINSLTSPKYSINLLRFFINGTAQKDASYVSQNDNIQPRVTILMKVQTKLLKDQTEMIVQTTVSQRNLNVK